MIRMLDHTADVGFELEAPTLEELFEEARRALLTVVFERAPDQGEGEHRVSLSAPDLETLMVRWINELVFYIQDRGSVPVLAEDLMVDKVEGSLEATLATAELDAGRYGWQGEIKSATYHGLDVRYDGANWRARVILDV